MHAHAPRHNVCCRWSDIRKSLICGTTHHPFECQIDRFVLHCRATSLLHHRRLLAQLLLKEGHLIGIYPFGIVLYQHDLRSLSVSPYVLCRRPELHGCQLLAQHSQYPELACTGTKLCAQLVVTSTMLL